MVQDLKEKEEPLWHLLGGLQNRSKKRPERRRRRIRRRRRKKKRRRGRVLAKIA